MGRVRGRCLARAPPPTPPPPSQRTHAPTRAHACWSCSGGESWESLLPSAPNEAAEAAGEAGAGAPAVAGATPVEAAAAAAGEAAAVGEGGAAPGAAAAAAAGGGDGTTGGGGGGSAGPPVCRAAFDVATLLPRARQIFEEMLAGGPRLKPGETWWVVRLGGGWVGGRASCVILAACSCCLAAGRARGFDPGPGALAHPPPSSIHPSTHTPAPRPPLVAATQRWPSPRHPPPPPPPPPTQRPPPAPLSATQRWPAWQRCRATPPPRAPPLPSCSQRAWPPACAALRPRWWRTLRLGRRTRRSRCMGRCRRAWRGRGRAGEGGGRGVRGVRGDAGRAHMGVCVRGEVG